VLGGLGGAEHAKQRTTATGRELKPNVRSLLSAEELRLRPSRPADYAAENQALIALAQELASSPEGILQKLADTALGLCRAHSAGLSLLEEGDGKSNFHWRAIAGQWAPHLNGGTPRNFGPCGTVLDQDAAMICSHPEVDFPYWEPIRPVLEEGLVHGCVYLAQMNNAVIIAISHFRSMTRGIHVAAVIRC
jgi:hypothetical protein